MDEGKKNAFQIRSTNDIRQHARDWTLAGDVGLLAHLEEFSENICNRTQETQKHLTELKDNYEEVLIKVSNITNQFLALQNCQFVENRVYDEDTPVEEKQEVKTVPDEVEQEKLILNQYKKAVEAGVKLLDTHFYEVHLPPNSDSEEEDEGSTVNSLIWKPKNPYVGKKFPCLIGSSEWWSDDNVGLRDTEENLDTDKTISESESEFESPQIIENKLELSASLSSMEDEKVVPVKQTFMNSSSEDLFGISKENIYENNKSDIFAQDKTSILEESQIFSPLFENQDEIKTVNVDSSVGKIQVPEEEVIINEENKTQKPLKVENDFTKELMAKLVSVTKKIASNEEKKPENASPVKKTKEIKSFNDENLFDETDDSSDLFSDKKVFKKFENQSMFFDGQNDDDLFSGTNNLLFEKGDTFKSGTSNSKGIDKVSNKSKDIKIIPNDDSPVFNKPLINSLFEDIDDDDILFSTKPVESNKKFKSSPNLENNNQVKTQSFIPADSEKKNSEALFDDIQVKTQPFIPADSEKKSSEVLFDDNNAGFKSKVPKSQLFDTEVTENLDDKIFKELRNKENIPFLDEANEWKVKESKPQNSKNVPKSIVESSNEEKRSRNNFEVNPPKISSNKKISFIETDADQDDLFLSDSKEESLFKEEKKIGSLPKRLPAVEDEENDDDISLFMDKPKQDSLSISSSRSSLFDDVSASKSRLASVFEKDKGALLEDDLFNVSDTSLFGGETVVKAKENDLFTSKAVDITQESAKSSLFDNFDDSDDLFGSYKKEKVSKQNSIFDKTSDKQPEKEKKFTEKNFTEPNSLPGQETKNEIVLGKSIFSDDSDDNLFNVSPIESKSTVVKDSKENIEKISKIHPSNNKNLIKSENGSFQDILSKTNEHEIFTSEADDTVLFPGENIAESAKPKPPDTLNFLKNSALENKPQVKSVGKLNIPDNLKFKFESLAKNITPGQVKPKEEKKIEDLDDSSDTTNLLKCPSKNRVKIPVKRRPQSRRARHEAIRNSGANFGMNFEGKKEELETSKPEISSNADQASAKNTNLFSPVASNPLSPSTDEEDYFNVPELDTTFEKEDQSLFKNNLFQSSKDSKQDDLLFDGAPVLSPLTLKKDNEQAKNDTHSLFSSQTKSTIKKMSIFDDDDDDFGDDGLFKIQDSSIKMAHQAEKKEPEKQNLFQNVTKIFSEEDKLKDSLFDEDLEDEDDLFGGSLNKTPLTIPKEKINKNDEKDSKPTEKENPTFVDPLGLISGSN